MVSLSYSDLTVPGIFLEKQVPAAPPELMVGVPVFIGFVQPFTPADAAANREYLALLQPQPLGLWPEFLQLQRAFHGATDQRLGGFLVDAVQGFFENGGRLCYVYLIQAVSPPGVEVLSLGLKALEVLPDIDLVCAPGLMDGALPASTLQALQAVILEHCETMGDRFAILDAQNGPPEAVEQQRDALSQAEGDWARGSYGALYFPWLKVEGRPAGQPRAIPPCGHVAGSYARCDRTAGVHHAPANLPLAGVLDLTVNLSDEEQARLNPGDRAGVNCIRAFRGRGLRVWGARTLSPDPQWQYINVRRLVITVGRWIHLHLADAVFEPNDMALWRRLERELGVYCEALWRQGALQGTTAQEAFFVRCNADTNPPSLREVGQVGVELGLAPTLPGEFIRLLLIHGESGVTLTPVQPI